MTISDQPCVVEGLSDLRLSWIFEGPSVRISHYRCIAPAAGAGVEQAQPSHVIAFPLRGSFLLRGAGADALIDANCALLLNRGAAYRSSHPAGGGDEGSGIVIEEAQLIEAVAERDPRAADAHGGPFRKAWVPSSPRSYLLLRALLRELRAGQPDVARLEERAFLLVEDVLASLGDGQQQAHAAVRQARSRERVEAAKAVLNAHFAEKVRLRELARGLGVSPFHLCRVFRRETGLPIHRYLNRLRLRAALEGVEAGGGDLAGVALKTGFSSHSHFTASFRREFGMAPRQLEASLGKILTAPPPRGA
jgi:AraC family transcriptional regulator